MKRYIVTEEQIQTLVDKVITAHTANLNWRKEYDKKVNDELSEAATKIREIEVPEWATYVCADLDYNCYHGRIPDKIMGIEK